jgi:hypothetical protein
MAEFSQPLPELITLLIIPIVVYILGRVSEEGGKSAYRKWRGEIVFKKETEGETAALTIQTNSPVYLDDLTVHLKNKQFDVLSQIKDQLKVDQNKRIQFSPLDKIRIEGILQERGDRKLFVDAYIGIDNACFSEDLDVEYSKAEEFMENTKMTLETSRKVYNRFLL